nr:MAG TPA: hypothetical protein [Caudoviricetes sp.]
MLTLMLYYLVKKLVSSMSWKVIEFFSITYNHTWCSEYPRFYVRY